MSVTVISHHPVMLLNLWAVFQVLPVLLTPKLAVTIIAVLHKANVLRTKTGNPTIVVVVGKRIAAEAEAAHSPMVLVVIQILPSNTRVLPIHVTTRTQE